MKESCSLIGLIFLVSMTGLCDSYNYNQDDVTGEFTNRVRGEMDNPIRFVLMSIFLNFRIS